VTRADKAFEAVLNGAGDVSFRDFESVLRRLGFVLDRVSGSHRIYRHPLANRPLNIQPVGNKVKRYQLRQFRSIVSEFRIEPDKP